ncbi:TPA: LPXTG cell wall anchor domain-containing protein, partial [Bacillus cereus]|nr:LPXTG cell wall anchor domain-containing protein [Bacillus cereus]
AKVTTDKEGKATISDLPVGKYKLVEVESLPGYKKLAKPVSFEIKKGMTEVLSLKVENELVDKGSVEITKVDKESGALLKGVTFEVQDEQGKVVTKVTTDKEGKAKISDLSVGNYKLVEVESLPGYKKLAEPVSFEIKKGMTEVLSLKVENEQLDKGSVEITKVDKDSQKVLEGVVFEVQDDKGKVVTEVKTDKNGKAKISDLSVGKYKLVEKESLPGYKQLTEPVSFEITKGMTEVLSLKIENEMVDTGNVEITKIDKDNKAPLAGVVFEVQDDKGKVVTKVTTDKAGKATVSDLSVGKYKLVEVESLPGYKKLEKPVPFEIKKGMTKSLAFTVENEMVDTGNVEITKIDKDSKAPLENVVFEVRDSKGKVVAKVTTDKEGKANVSDLSVGKYKLVETKSLPGYKKLTEPVSFEITKGMTKVLSLKVENEQLDKGAVEITKMAAESKEVLSGAVFEVHDEKGKVVVKVTTDKEGKAKITDLSVGNYTLVEVEAPKGYEKLTNPIPFEITNGMINAVQLEVLNKLNHLAPPGPETPDPEKPGTPDPEKPGTPNPEKPGTPDPEKPGTPDPEKPGTPDPEKPGTPDPEKPGTPDPEKPGTPNPEKPEKELPKTGQKMPVEPYMGALLVMMSFGLLVLGRKQQR